MRRGAVSSLVPVAGDPSGEGGYRPEGERRVVPRVDHGDFATVLEFNPRASYAALAFVGPRPDISPDRGDWLMTINDPDWVTLHVCLIGSGVDFPDPASAVTASEITLSQVGYGHQRTPVDAHLTAAWEISEEKSR